MLHPTIKHEAVACPGLCVNIRKFKGGPILMRKDVGVADLMDHQSEAWLHLHLRKGRADVAFDDLKFELRPIYASGNAERLTGFALASAEANGSPLNYPFTIHAVEHIATRASRELIAAGVLQPGDEYYYDLGELQAAQQTTEVSDQIAITTASVKLQYLQYPLRSLVAKSKKIGPQDEWWTPVFYTRDAVTRAELYARRGGNLQPPVETGCILVGAPCSCPDTGEFYIVVRDAIEAQDANSQKFSLEYSEATWARMQAILRARRSCPGGHADRFLGQAHGHPFLPAGGAPPCELCDGKPEVPCSRTSCFVSLDDSDWSRAVFARQAWAICHIFGLNARQEHVHKLFGLRIGQLQERGFFVIPEFTPPA
jgi:hypothetical protein